VREANRTFVFESGRLDLFRFFHIGNIGEKVYIPKEMVRRVHMAGIFNVTTGRLHTSIISAKRRKESRERVQKKVSTLDLLAILARRFQQQR
jgi:hypothetical protein